MNTSSILVNVTFLSEVIANSLHVAGVLNEIFAVVLKICDGGNDKRTNKNRRKRSSTICSIKSDYRLNKYTNYPTSLN